MKNVALLCYCLPEGMFNDDHFIIFSHQELIERNECNAKSHITTNTNPETAKSHFTSDFSFRCKDVYWLLSTSFQKKLDLASLSFAIVVKFLEQMC